MEKTGVVVHVVAFEPRADKNRAGVGGFDWYRSAEDADAEYKTALGDQQQQEHDSHSWFRFDALVSSEEAATDEIDEQWDQWSQFPSRPQPVDLRR